jgi:hypothetical protein
VRKAALKLDLAVREVRAMLVLAGRRADSRLRDFAEHESLRIVELEPATIGRVAGGGIPDTELRNLARDYLGISGMPAPAGQTPSTRGVKG